MTDAVSALDGGQAKIDRLAADWAADARAEARFLEENGTPPRMALHLALAALTAAAQRLRWDLHNRQD